MRYLQRRCLVVLYCRPFRTKRNLYATASTALMTVLLMRASAGCLSKVTVTYRGIVPREGLPVVFFLYTYHLGPKATMVVKLMIQRICLEYFQDTATFYSVKRTLP